MVVVHFEFALKGISFAVRYSYRYQSGFNRAGAPISKPNAA
jgi:hypothetical protein